MPQGLMLSLCRIFEHFCVVGINGRERLPTSCVCSGMLLFFVCGGIIFAILLVSLALMTWLLSITLKVAVVSGGKIGSREFLLQTLTPFCRQRLQLITSLFSFDSTGISVFRGSTSLLMVG